MTRFTPIPGPRATHPVNAAVLAYLDGRSAHSDVAEDLMKAVEPLAGVEAHCPDPAAYRSVAVSTGGVIFAFAVGMGTLGFRVGPHVIAATEAGGMTVPELGVDWALFDRRPGRPSPDLKLWARRAYVAAAVSGGGTNTPPAADG